MSTSQIEEIQSLLEQFHIWLEAYGQTSQDPYDFMVSSYGQWARSLYYRSPLLGIIPVAPLVFLELFAPSLGKWFSPRRRFPIVDAHYAMGFVYLFQATGRSEYYIKAREYLEILKKSRCPGYKYYCWGYPFDWVNVSGICKAYTPLITTTPYVYEAFAAVYDLQEEDDQWLDIMHQIAEHVLHDIRDKEVAPGACSCSYSPANKRQGVVNASAYRTFLLAEASHRFSDNEYWRVGEKNLNFVLESQQPDGSWFYAMDGKDRFIDHFHTCFVIKNLIKVERLVHDTRCKEAIEKGVDYYLSNLIDANGLPKPFAIAPRLVLYRRDLYNYAESINLGLLLRRQFEAFNSILESQLKDLTTRWKKPDGSFRSRQLLFGWNNVPYHRWAQSQLFRSLSLWLNLEQQDYKRRRKLGGI